MNISREYFLKSRQLTWKNAFDKFFGPLPLEEKNEIWNEAYQNTSTEDSIGDSLATQGDCQLGYEETKKRMCVHLDYNKVINVRVSLAPVDLNVNLEPPSRPGRISFSKGDPSIVGSLSKCCSGDDRNECTICHKRFTQKGDLTVHLRTHTGEKPFSCPQCEKKFSEKGSLKKHSLLHSGTKEFSCDVCHKAFMHKSTLTAHRRTHTGDKPFKCNVCNAMFSTSSNLNTHMRTHTGETPYECETCERKFTHLTSLKTHLLVHSEEKPFACTYANCNKTFRQKGNLQAHVRLHTKDKPYSCPKCHKTFSQSSNCKIHTKQCSVVKSVSADDSFNA